MENNIKEFFQIFTCADISKTKNDLGWNPKYDFSKAINNYIDWIKKQNIGI